MPDAAFIATAVAHSGVIVSLGLRLHVWERLQVASGHRSDCMNPAGLRFTSPAIANASKP